MDAGHTDVIHISLALKKEAQTTPAEAMSAEMMAVAVELETMAAEAMPAEAPGVTVAGHRDVYFDGQIATNTMVLQRAELVTGAAFVGPAIVEQFDATTLVPPGWCASVDRNGSLLLERDHDG